MKTKNKKLGPYGISFINHISSFIKQTKFVFPKQVAVAVSGGKDSMALLHILSIFRDRGEFEELHVFHVNHGTRIDNTTEQEMVRDYCQKYNGIFHLKKLKLSFSANFEKEARDLRRSFFSTQMQELDLDSCVCTGHHLDDSFEWTLMQQFKSSNLKGSLGIPLKQDFYFRPLLCVSKAQLERYIVNEDIEYMDDPSNYDDRFERNYIRKYLIPKIKKKYPQYLKHYAYRQNILAKKMRVSYFEAKKDQNFEVIKMNDYSIVINKEGLGDFRGQDELISKEVQRLSSKGRGRLAKQVSQVIKAAYKGKDGPFDLSGGVKAYHFQGSIVLLNQKGLDYFSVLDGKLLLGTTQIPELLDKWPLLAFGNKKIKQIYPSLKRPHPLLPMFSQYLLDKNYWIQHYGRLVALENKSILPRKDIQVYNLKDVMRLDSL